MNTKIIRMTQPTEKTPGKAIIQIGKYVLEAHQILGGTDYRTQPFHVTLWEPVSKRFDHATITTFDHIRGFHGKVTMRRHECRFPVGNRRFAWYGTFRRRLSAVVARWGEENLKPLSQYGLKFD